MIDTVVDARGDARTLQEFGMSFDAKESSGLAGRPDGSPNSVETHFDRTKVGSGNAAMAVAGGKLIRIIAPVHDAQPALWWSWPRTAIEVATEGSQRLLSERPRVIEISGPSGSLVLGMVDKIYRSDVRRDAAGTPVDKFHGEEKNAFPKPVGQN